MNRLLKITLTSVAVLAGTSGVAGTAAAQDNAAYEEALAEVERTFGFVPSFIREAPKVALPGAWAGIRDVELSETTALPPKYKVLISLAVAAQIPCHYCVWLDTMSARQLGATDAEIEEAVAMSALTRQWSTILNGMQVDFDVMKREFGGEAEAAAQ